jgi:hypothetical protein
MNRMRCHWMDLKLPKISSYLYELREVPQGYNELERVSVHCTAGTRGPALNGVSFAHRREG